MAITTTTARGNVTSLSDFKAAREANEAFTATKVAAIIAEAAEAVRRLHVACPDEVHAHAGDTLAELADISHEYARNLRMAGRR